MRLHEEDPPPLGRSLGSGGEDERLKKAVNVWRSSFTPHAVIKAHGYNMASNQKQPASTAMDVMT
ncbi:hypothetical protein EYF80_058656 [Liparis tanakae]|uniref:Uncharacterized protein n=1 Tax=Liparis tanakae TaxID=230148 RepID=A0A4Z2ESD8_9TELE|nr:hypothetical protein EYF80_058656 [Liparis tanakae]